MPKRKRKPKKHTLELMRGCFYNVHEGSRTGHPGRIEIVDRRNDIYVSVTTRSLTKEEYLKNKKRKDYVPLSRPTTKDVYKSYIHKRPFKGSRDDYGDVEYKNMTISETDEHLVKQALKRNPRLGRWYKNKKPSS